MLHISNEYGLIIASPDVRPDTSWGTAITPGNNAYGSWTEIASAATVTDDTCWVEVTVHAIGAAAKASDSLTRIGVDPAGGTSYTTIIPDLLTSYASIIGSTGDGVTFGFPLRIRAGSSIAAAGSINNATVGTQRVGVKLYCKPSRPELLHVGDSVTAYGTDTAGSCGAAVTYGTVSKGSWTSLGTASKAHFYWHVAGAPKNLGTVLNGGGFTDLAFGDGTNFKQALLNELDNYASNESRSTTYKGAYAYCPSGTGIYVRGIHGNSTTDFSCIAYGVT